MKPKKIVLLHGWGAKTQKLKALKISLEKLGWKVFLPKLPGFEKKPPRKVWGIKEYSDFVYKETRKKFGNSSYFVFGHSFGGGIALKLASEDSKNILGLILCATRGVSRGKFLKRLIFWTLAKTGKIFLVFPPLAKGFKKILYKVAREHDYEKAEGIMRQVFKKVISEDLKPVIKKIKVPTLILWGSKDTMTPVKDAYYIKNILSKSKLVVYRGLGHRLPYDIPDNLAKQIEKWSKTYF